jgi:hypothetical protein
MRGQPAEIVEINGCHYGATRQIGDGDQKGVYGQLRTGRNLSKQPRTRTLRCHGEGKDRTRGVGADGGAS